jgi:arylformamidase
MSDQAKRVVFDFELDFTNGGGMQGQDFRLDIAGEDISDRELAAYLVRDMRLLLVGEVRILNKRIISEPHKRQSINASGGPGELIDLSHTIRDGLVTYKGLPAPVICDYLSREESRSRYAPGTEFQIGKIEMISNTGTYLDSPFHRYAGGKDLAGLNLEDLANLAGLVIRANYAENLAIGPEYFEGREIRGKAVLVNTGWDKRWNTENYYEGHPFLTGPAAEFLVKAGARLVGVDSHNIDDTRPNTRPVHTILLQAGVLIVEHLTRLDRLPEEGFLFSAIPPMFEGVGTFPVRAFAQLI